jgi:hypothetical protein
MTQLDGDRKCTVNTFVGTSSSNALATSRTAAWADSAVTPSNYTNFQADLGHHQVRRNEVIIRSENCSARSDPLSGKHQRKATFASTTVVTRRTRRRDRAG